MSFGLLSASEARDLAADWAELDDDVNIRCRIFSCVNTQIKKVALAGNYTILFNYEELVIEDVDGCDVDVYEFFEEKPTQLDEMVNILTVLGYKITRTENPEIEISWK